jgi:hypothetical protein
MTACGGIVAADVDMRGGTLSTILATPASMFRERVCVAGWGYISIIARLTECIKSALSAARRYGMCSKFVNFVVRQKYRYDLAASYLALVNFALLIVAVSDKISTHIHIRPMVVIPALILGAFLILWLTGYFLDVVAHTPHKLDLEQASRSPTWGRLFKQLDRIENGKGKP